MSNIRLCSKDEINILDELKGFMESLNDIGIEAGVVAFEDGEITGTFSVDKNTKFVCVMNPENGDYKRTNYIEEV